MTIPRVFFSYSHDSQGHKKWVLELAIRLRNNGIDAIIDQFELRPGDDVPHFMETNLSAATKILMICTERYVEKANRGEGGVGYEKMIITSYLLQKIDENKIIPILRHKSQGGVPTFLKTKLYIDFSKDDDFEFSYDDLVRAIHNAPLFEKPPVGNSPFTPVLREKLDGDISTLNEVLFAIAVQQGTGRYASSQGVVKDLRISAPLFIVLVNKLEKLGYAKWDSPKPSFVIMTDKGYEYLKENDLIR